MIHAEHTVEIAHPAAVVFAYVADGTNDRHWRDGVVSVERTSVTATLGATYAQVLQGPGRARVPGDYTIDRYEPGRLLGFVVTAGPVRPSGLFTFAEPAAGLTTLTYTLDVEPSGAMRLMAKMIAKELAAEVRSIERLKHVLEGI
jgi:uncharacterized protein YndB with AHSA1/START domain